MNEPAAGRGAAFGDLDNDGDVGVVINNLDCARRVLRNDGGNKNNFVVINLNGSKSNRSAFGARVKVIAGDLDNDGDVDLVINNLDCARRVLRNDGGNKNNFVVINLSGSRSNRSAFAAKIQSDCRDLVQIAERRSSGSYISRNDKRLHFGLERRTKVDAVEVRWPNGHSREVIGIPVNTFISIREGKGSWTEGKRKQKAKESTFPQPSKSGC